MGSIPAGAGEPESSGRSARRRRVYPRGCGGTDAGRRYVQDHPGLSPRVRGNRQPCATTGKRLRSIPAGAGEPWSTRLVRRVVRVYPRGCGGTPASASSSRSPRVYPRGCGGTVTTAWIPVTDAGLSPRVRGNHHGIPRGASVAGSIPAGAGEPKPRRGCPRPGWVYPRGCGGTRRRRRRLRVAPGLSPRVRGNRHDPAAVASRRRSIPAGAGEPVRRTSPGRSGQVYPRGCGGTGVWTAIQVFVLGLSPRVRGNPRLRGRRGRLPGSIPAGAGEPISVGLWWGSSKVYPRGCGGTPDVRQVCVLVRGLSPRVRGNPVREREAHAPQGSIPAGAGEPTAPPSGKYIDEVYPRGCGGTGPVLRGPRWRSGLSPRVRGNRGDGAEDVGLAGSIPAGAGEPRPNRPRPTSPRVYPRGCGGTATDSGVAVVTFWVYPRGCGGTATDSGSP